MHGQVLIILSLVAASSAITTQELDAVKQICRDDVLDGGRNVPPMVRLAFHDCVGGCNGCIDTNNPSNAGLQRIFRRVSRVYNDNNIRDQYSLSRADFLALCGVTASEEAFDPPGKTFTFRVGRTDADSCEGDNDGKFPSSLAGFYDTMDFFGQMFGFSHFESIVIMGAHSLGGANRDNSGFQGPWSNDPMTLDNDYYAVLLEAVDVGWEQNEVDPGDGKFQWGRPRRQEEQTQQTQRRRLMEKLMSMLSEPDRKKRAAAHTEAETQDLETLLDLLKRQGGPNNRPNGGRNNRPNGGGRNDGRNGGGGGGNGGNSNGGNGNNGGGGGGGGGDRRRMMLNADMCLAKFLELGGDGSSGCGDNVATCVYSPGIVAVRMLATNNDLFLDSYIAAFTKMIEKTDATLELPTDGSGAGRKRTLNDLMEILLEALEED